MAEGTSAAAVHGERGIPHELLDELGTTVATVFERAICACNASSSLERMDDIRASIKDRINTTLALPMRVRNARLSLQDRLPTELWLDVWMRLPLSGRVAVSHVCSRWRGLIVQSPDIWSAIDCFAGTCTAPDGSSFRHSTAVIVPLALERAKGTKLSLTFALDHDLDLSYVHRFAEILAPHACTIVGINITGTTQHYQLLLEFLRPLTHIRWISHVFPAFGTYYPSWRLIFSPQGVLPELKALVLPYHQPYIWLAASYGNDDDARLPRFPALQMLRFSPAGDVDIARALIDCPIVSSLTLVLGSYFYTSEAHLDHPQMYSNHLTHLYLHEVPSEQVAWVLSTFNVSLKQHVVLFVQDVADGVPHRTTDDLEPSPDDLGQGSDTTGAGGRSNARRLYLRVSRAAKRIFRKTQRDDTLQVTDARQPSPVAQAGPPPHVRAPEGLHALGGLFCDLSAPVDVLVIGHTIWDAWGTPTLGATIRVTDTARRTRIAGLKHDTNVPIFLFSVWDEHLPLVFVSRLVVEFGLFCALVASLPDKTPIHNLEVLFYRSEQPEQMADNGSEPVPLETNAAVTLGTCERAVFPALRTLRFGLFDVNCNVRTLLHAEDIGMFVDSLGCRPPLNSITLARGVDVWCAALTDRYFCTPEPTDLYPNNNCMFPLFLWEKYCRWQIESMPERNFPGS